MFPCAAGSFWMLISSYISHLECVGVKVFTFHDLAILFPDTVDRRAGSWSFADQRNGFAAKVRLGTQDINR